MTLTCWVSREKTEILARAIIALLHAQNVLSSARCKYAVVKKKPVVIESGALVAGVDFCMRLWCSGWTFPASLIA